MYRIVASDMDETFLGHDKRVPEANLAAVKAMRENGVKFVVATGRPFFSVQDTLEELGTKGDPNAYTISLNGGMVCANDGRVVASHTLAPSVVNRLITFGEENGLCGHVYVDGRTYVMNINESEHRFLTGRMEVEQVSWDEVAALDEPVFKILFEDTDLDRLHELREEVLAVLGDDAALVEPVFSSDRYVEFNHAGVGKGSGLTELSALLDVPMDETVAVGDSVNDLSMLEAAGLPVVVSNVSELARPLLPEYTRILESSCDDGCMKEVWERYVEPSLDR